MALNTDTSQAEAPVCQTDSAGENTELLVQDASPAPCHKENISQIHSAIPPEILAEIFTIACHADSHNFHSSSDSEDSEQSKRTTPFIIGHVCEHWREIVWSTPDIWSHVSLRAACTNSSRHKGQVSLVKEWLSRSKTCPLSINLSSLHDNGQDANSDNVPRNLLKLFLCHADRWFAVHLVVPSAWHVDLETIINSIPNFPGFPLLANLRMEPIRFDDALHRRELFKIAPALHNMHLRNYPPSVINIPWAQLTSLTLGRMGLDYCTAILPNITSLRYLHIFRLHRYHGDPFKPARRSMLRDLEKVVFDQLACTETETLFLHMSLPVLRDLELRTITHTQFSDVPVFLQASDPFQLTKLKLTNFRTWPCRGTENELVNALREVPTLEIIEFSMPDDNATVFILPVDLLRLTSSKLSSEGTGTDVQSHNKNQLEDHLITFHLPNLKSVDISGPSMPRNNHFDESLLEGLQLRRAPAAQVVKGKVSSLLSFRVTSKRRYHHPVRPEVIEGLQNLVEGGLNLEMVFGGISWL